jgi:hypothetical protein
MACTRSKQTGNRELRRPPHSWPGLSMCLLVSSRYCRLCTGASAGHPGCWAGNGRPGIYRRRYRSPRCIHQLRSTDTVVQGGHTAARFYINSSDHHHRQQQAGESNGTKTAIPGGTLSFTGCGNDRSCWSFRVVPPRSGIFHPSRSDPLPCFFCGGNHGSNLSACSFRSEMVVDGTDLRLGMVYPPCSRWPDTSRCSLVLATHKRKIQPAARMPACPR